MSVTRTCPDCGYSRSYATVRLADVHHRRHSCGKQRRADQQARRRAERLHSRMRRDCSHPRALHVHGTRVAYVKDHCRCTECTAANSAASRAAHRAQTFGRWQPFVDAGPVRDHIRALRATGIGVQRIAALAGIATSHVRALADAGTHEKPPIRRVRPGTAQRVLNVSVKTASRAPRSRIDATGTRRRLQALIAIGWTEQQLASLLHRSTSSLHRSMNSQSVAAQTATDIDALYQRLWNTRPPQKSDAEREAAHSARAHAATRGWLPPLAWDDINTDPEPRPDAAPSGLQEDIDEVAIERALGGHGIRLNDLTCAEQRQAIRELTRRGKSIGDIAEQLGTTKRTVSRRRASLRPKLNR